MERTPSPGRTGRGLHLACILLLVALGMPAYYHFFSKDTGALSRDFGTIFLSKMQQQYDALQDGRLLLWDPILYGGTALWPLPNTAGGYPPLLLSFLVRGSPLGGLNLAVLIHVLFGAAGVYVLLFHMTGRHYAALAAGALFLYARYTQQFAFVLPLDSMALAWLPWTLYLLIRSVGGSRWIPWAMAAGMAYSAVSWSGGYIIFLYGLLTAGLVVLGGSCRKPLLKNGLRCGGILAVFLATFLVLSAGRLLPTWRWMPLTSRGDPIPFDFATQGTSSLSDMFASLHTDGWFPPALMLLALGFGLLRRRAWAVPFGLVAGLILVLSSGIIARFLYDYVPGFDRIREPRRAWLLMAVVFPVMAGLGIAHVQSWIRLPVKVALAAGACFLAFLAADNRVWSTFRRPYLHSLSARLAANELHQDLARRAKEESRFRVHDYADTRGNLKRTADLIRSAFRLESLEAVLGNIAVKEYDRDYFASSSRYPARLWGFMNCRYVTSGEPLNIPQFELVGKYKEDRFELKEDSDGPYLYRNELELPRAYLVDHAALITYTGPYEWRDWRAMVYDLSWNQKTAAMIRSSSGKLGGMEPEFFSRFDATVVFGEEGLAEELKERFTSAGVPLLESRTMPNRWAVSRKCGEILEAAKTKYQRIADPEPGWNEARLTLPGDAGGRWLILAETYSIYPGWTAEVDGKAVPLFTANGAATAIPLPEGARKVYLSYVPPGYYAGLAISLAGLVCCVILLWKSISV